MTVRIVGGNVRDLSYIAANLRPQDRAEIDCQVPDWHPVHLALSALQGQAYIVEVDGNPEAAFGAGEKRKGLWVAWSWGTPRIKRAVPYISRFIRDVMGPDILAKGANRVEAFAMAGNGLAERWLTDLGATRRCDLPDYGINGEPFILFDWTRESWANVFRLQPAGAEAAPEAAVTAGRGNPRA
jgi:hypothetical protein